MSSSITSNPHAVSADGAACGGGRCFCSCQPAEAGVWGGRLECPVRGPAGSHCMPHKRGLPGAAACLPAAFPHWLSSPRTFCPWHQTQVRQTFPGSAHIFGGLTANLSCRNPGQSAALTFAGKKRRCISAHSYARPLAANRSMLLQLLPAPTT